jgi:hypothetical protein
VAHDLSLAVRYDKQAMEQGRTDVALRYTIAARAD